MHFKKLVMSLGLIMSLSFLGCGGGSSQEAKELLQKLLNVVGIAYNIIATVCQDDNSNGFCESTELQAKLFIEQGDTAESIWQKLTQIEEGRYFLETYDVTQPILLVLQDVDNVHYDEGKFTLNFNGFSSNEINETKELSILESMVDADAISVDQADKFRTLTNPEAQEKYYAELLLSLETNINTLRAKELDSQAAVAATIQEMADETIANQAQADKINACENNQTCVDEEIKTLSDELIITEEESNAIVTTPTPTPTPAPTQTPISTAQTSTSKLTKTGQKVSYESYDDGYYQIGVTPSYSRNGEIVTDNVTGLMWQDSEEAAADTKTWDEATSYCNSLSLGGYSDWRLPNDSELQTLVDYGVYDPAIDPTFVHVASNFYWSSTSSASDSTSAWVVYFYGGADLWNLKSGSRYVRCVRGGN